MIKQVIQLLALVILSASCREPDNSSHLTTLVKGLENANKIHFQNNEHLYNDLVYKLQKQQYYDESVRWVPKVKRLRDLTADILSYVGRLEKELLIQSESKHKVQRVLIKNRKVHDLFVRLFAYKQDLLALMKHGNFEDNPLMREVAQRDSLEYVAIIPVISNSDTSAENEQTWLDSTFNNVSALTCRAILSTIENNILISENLLLDFIDRQTTILICGVYERYYPIATLSSNHIKSADSIEVTFGMGSFTLAPKPRFFIDDKHIEPTDDGVAVYFFRPKGKPGKYTIPVRMEFINTDGSKSSLHKNIPYTVVD